MSQQELILNDLADSIIQGALPSLVSEWYEDEKMDIIMAYNDIVIGKTKARDLDTSSFLEKMIERVMR
jgi:hypothetical protein